MKNVDNLTAIDLHASHRSFVLPATDGNLLPVAGTITRCISLPRMNYNVCKSWRSKMGSLRVLILILGFLHTVFAQTGQNATFDIETLPGENVCKVWEVVYSPIVINTCYSKTTSIFMDGCTGLDITSVPTCVSTTITATTTNIITASTTTTVLELETAAFASLVTSEIQAESTPSAAPAALSGLKLGTVPPTSTITKTLLEVSSAA